MSDTLRVLTVRQPWAWAIVHGGKDVENRTRNIAGAYRGPVAIHAGLAKYEQHNQASRAHRAAHGSEVPKAIAFGTVIGLVDLVDVHHHSSRVGCYRRADILGWVPADGSDASDEGWAPYVCSPWSMPGYNHLVLANPRPLASPIPAKGKLGLWRPDATLEAAIWEQVTR